VGRARAADHAGRHVADQRGDDAVLAGRVRRGVRRTGCDQLLVAGQGRPPRARRGRAGRAARREARARPRLLRSDCEIFILAFFALGYLVLAGADIGVGMALPYLGRTPEERREVIAAIAPFFLGNEVWLVVTAGVLAGLFPKLEGELLDRKSTRLNSSHVKSSYAV